MSLSHCLAGTAIAARDERMAERCVIEALVAQCEIGGMAVDQYDCEQDLRAWLETFDWSATREDMGKLAPLLLTEEDDDQDFTEPCVDAVVSLIAAYAARDMHYLVGLRPQLAYDLLQESRALDEPAKMFDDQGNAGEVVFWPEGHEVCLVDWTQSGGSLAWEDLDQLMTPLMHENRLQRRRDKFLAEVAEEADDGRRYSVYGPVRGRLANGVTRGQAIVTLLQGQEGCSAQGGYSDAYILVDDLEQADDELDEQVDEIRRAYGEIQ